MTAGTNNGQPATLADLRRERKVLREQVELQRLRHEQLLLEHLVLADEWGWDADMWRRLRGQPHDGTWLPPSQASGRRHGANWPLWQTEDELGRLRERSRIVVATNPYAQALVRNFANYVIGDKFTYKVQSKEQRETGRQLPPGLRKLIRRAQDVMDRFLKANRWNGTVDPRTGHHVLASSRERELLRRNLRDGETLLRFHPDEGLGTVLVRFAEPEQLRDPPGATFAEGWSFGVRHQMDPFEDVETREEYHFVWQDLTTAARPQTFGELVPAGEVLHLLGPDADGAVKRGVPWFAYGVADALDRAEKLERNASVGAAIRAATAEIWQHATGTQAQISSLAAGLRETTETDPVSGREENVERIRSGAIRRVPAGQMLTGHPPDQTASYLQGVQGDLRAASGAFCAPEYWTGDASNGNYSSLESASAPTVRAGQVFQSYYTTACQLAAWRAVAYAVERGELPAEVYDLVEIVVQGPAVLHRNEFEKAQSDQIKVAIRAKSPQTVAMEDGLDPEIEAANIEEHEERFGGLGQALDLPGADVGTPPAPGPVPGTGET